MFNIKFRARCPQTCKIKRLKEIINRDLQRHKNVYLNILMTNNSTNTGFKVWISKKIVMAGISRYCCQIFFFPLRLGKTIIAIQELLFKTTNPLGTVQ